LSPRTYLKSTSTRTSGHIVKLEPELREANKENLEEEALAAAERLQLEGGAEVEPEHEFFNDAMGSL